MVILAIASMPVLKLDLHDEKVKVGTMRKCTDCTCTQYLSMFAVFTICDFDAVSGYRQVLK